MSIPDASGSPAPSPPAWITPRRLIMAMFFVQAVSLSSWFPRIPDVQAKLGLSPGTLAVCLVGMSLGSFTVTLFSGPLIARFSPRRIMQVGLCIFYVVLIGPGLAWNAPSLLVTLALMGSSYVTADVAMNVEATRIQEATGRRIVSTCHGLWSAGSVLGSVIGGQFAEAAVPTWLHLLLMSIVALPLALWLVRALPVFRPAPDEGRRPIFAVPTLALLGLCIYAFGATLGELTTRNWGAVYLRDVIGASPATTGIALGLFAMMMAAGRLSGDRLADRFGPVAVGRFCSAMAVAGVLLLVLSNSGPAALVAFAAIGLGVSVGFPLSISAAAARGDRPPAINVASLALIAYSGSLVGPPLVGFVADNAGLRVGMAALLPLLILSGLFAGELGPRTPAAQTDKKEEEGIP